ncbi:MAG: flagellar basal-body MS-ring/collar protein FliF [Nocardioidaceae bacterium]
MRDQITGRLQSLQRSFGSFTAGQKTIAVIGGLALVLGAVMVFRWASAPSYAPLFTNMAPADASAVVDKLNAAGTPYQLADSGSTVLVPQNQVYDSRIKLSGEGLPSQSSDGYGLLDKQSLSTSKFQEDVAFKRATEGELQKTIAALDSVDSAVVHVAMPKEELFATDSKPTTASVLVKTRPGMTLDSSQVQSIVHLTASSVTGLDPKNVTVTDSAGNVLNTSGGDAGSLAGTRAEQVSAYEERVQGNVSTMLDKIVGPGNSAVKVTADLDFDKTLTKTTRYFDNKNSRPISESGTSETYSGNGTGAGGSVNGVVGPDGELDPTTTSSGTNANGTGDYVNRNYTRDNPVGSVVEEREAAPGVTKKLSVGVVVDTQSLGANSPNQVQALVASSLGVPVKSVNVTTMPFDQTSAKAAAADLAAAQQAESRGTMIGYARTGGMVLVGLLALLVAWLRGRKRRKAREEATSYVVEQLRRKNEPAPALPAGPTAAELEAGNPAELRTAARDEIAAMVERQPEEVAQLLRGWLVETDA